MKLWGCEKENVVMKLWERKCSYEKEMKLWGCEKENIIIESVKKERKCILDEYLISVRNIEELDI